MFILTCHYISLRYSFALCSIHHALIHAPRASTSVVEIMADDKAEFLRRENERLQVLIFELEAKIEDRELKFNDLISQQKRMEADLLLARRAAAEAKKKASRLSIDLFDIKQDSAMRQSSVTKQYQALNKITQAMLAKDDEIADFKAAHKRELRRKDEQISKLRTLLHEDDSTIAHISKETIALQSELETTNEVTGRKLARLEGKVAQLRRELGTCEDSVGSTNTVITNFQDDMATVNEINRILRSDVKRWQMVCEKTQFELEAEADRAAKELISSAEALKRIDELRAATEAELLECRLELAARPIIEHQCDGSDIEEVRIRAKGPRKPEPLNSWVIICPSMVAVIPDDC